jgi:hypothetical protein
MLIVCIAGYVQVGVAVHAIPRTSSIKARHMKVDRIVGTGHIGPSALAAMRGTWQAVSSTVPRLFNHLLQLENQPLSYTNG